MWLYFINIDTFISLDFLHLRNADKYYDPPTPYFRTIRKSYNSLDFKIILKTERKIKDSWKDK